MKKSLKRLSILCLSLLTCATIGVAAGCDGFEATQSGYQQGIECLQGNHIWDVQVAVDGHQSVCTHCGTKKEVEPHFGGEATCTDKAVCDGCGEAYGETLEHQHNELKSNEEEHWYECECGEKVAVEDHRGGNATCTEKAVCADCGVEYGETLPHVYDTLKHNSDVHWYECACGEKSDIKPHFGGEATYNQKAVCELCGEEYGEFANANAYTLTILNYAPLAKGQENKALSIAEGEVVTLEDPAEIAGLIFKGYVAEDGSAATLPQTMPSENVTLTAVWEVVPYTVTFVYPEHYAGEKMTTITFGVMKDEANGITVTASEAAALVSEWAKEFDYETEGYTFAIANADAIPAEFAAQNYEYEVVETIKEFTATVTLANGSKAKISYNINNKEEKLAEIQALLPENTAEYSYAWVKAPTELKLADCAFTINKTTNNYQVIVRDKTDAQVKSVKINVNNYKTVEAEINALLPTDAQKAYNYTWKTWVGSAAAETGLEKVVLTLDLANLNKTQYFQVVEEEVVHYVTVKHGYGNPHPQEKVLEYTKSTLDAVKQQVEDMLPEDSEICSYYWLETGTRYVGKQFNVNMGVYGDLVFTMARNPVPFTLTVIDLNGAETTYNYNYVDDKTSDLNSVNVQNTINGKLPDDTKQYTYTWAETGTRTIDLTKGSTFTMKKEAVKYTANVYVKTNEYDVLTEVKYGEFEYTVDTLTEVAAQIDELLTENNKYYSYVWTPTGNRNSIASYLTKQINNGKKTFDLKMTATLNEYTATVEYAYGTQADEVVEFTAKTLAAAQEQVLELLPDNDEYYTYAWDKEVKLELCDSLYTISRTPVEYTAHINTMNGQQTFTYTCENAEDVEDQINDLLLPEEDGYVYVWTDGVNFYTEIVLPFGAGEECTFTMVKQTATYKAIVHYPNGGATLHMFTKESMEDVEEYINGLLEADNEQYTYTWQNGTRVAELTLADSEWTIVKKAVDYVATIYTFTEVKSYTFNADNKAAIEAEINALKPTNNEVYTFGWQKNAVALETVELAYTNAENANVFTLTRKLTEYTATIKYWDSGRTDEVVFNAEDRAYAEQTIALKLPKDDADYTYNWNKDIVLTLKDCEFTIERTAVEYTATVVDYEGLVIGEYAFTVETMEDVEAVIKSKLPGNTDAYTYAWDEEVELTLEDSTWTMVQTAVEYTATVNMLDNKQMILTFTFETLDAVEAKVEELLDDDTLAYTYTWAETKTREVELTLANSEWTMVQTAVPYKATVVDLDGKETEQWFTVETMATVEEAINELLDKDTAAYTYVWKETGTREVKLTLADSTWTMVETAVEYTATVVDYEGNATTYDFTTETMATVEKA
ncbi:MAG: hypothetical protein IJW96_05065, partial [Clostridia bacterium]|nr:hypothetical protein [Clostridia bacterium]